MLRSPEEVSAKLPLVKSVIMDIVGLYPKIAVSMKDADRAKKAYDIKKTLKSVDALREDFEIMQNYIDEIAKIGGRVRNAEYGIVDFRGIYKRRVVNYCWCLGESCVNHYHELIGVCSRRVPI